MAGCINAGHRPRHHRAPARASELLAAPAGWKPRSATKRCWRPRAGTGYYPPPSLRSGWRRWSAPRARATTWPGNCSPNVAGPRRERRSAARPAQPRRPGGRRSGVHRIPRYSAAAEANLRRALHAAALELRVTAFGNRCRRAPAPCPWRPLMRTRWGALRKAQRSLAVS